MADEEERRADLERVHPHTAHLREAVIDTTDRLGITHTKHRPRIAGGGENLPLEILRALSIWISVLDERGVVPGKPTKSSHILVGRNTDSFRCRCRPWWNVRMFGCV